MYPAMEHAWRFAIELTFVQLLAGRGFNVGLLNREEAVKLRIEVMSVGTVVLMLTAEESDDAVELIFVIGDAEAADSRFGVLVEFMFEQARSLAEDRSSSGLSKLTIGR